MTNQEIVQALQEYVQMDQQLAQLAQQKAKLEKEIKHYQILREKPKPQYPSKFRTFYRDLGLFLFGCCLLALLVEGFGIKLPQESILWILPGAIILFCIFFYADYKREKSEACARYVTAGMHYEEWEKGKKEQLPILRNKLDQVMNQGKNLYQKLQNAKLRTFLHSDYLPYLSTILGYFQRGRARDLTEAVNLLERELLEYRRDMETAAYRKEMRQQAHAQTVAAEEAAEQSRQAAAASKEAAFWGAAATFVAASNSKKDDNGNYRVV